MSQTLNYKHKIKNIIQLLTQWSKKPSLDHDLSAILNEYNYIVNNGSLNFSETAVIVQFYAHIYERKIDFLYKELFELSVRLCSALSRPEEEKPKEPTPNNSEAEVGHPEVSQTQQYADLAQAIVHEKSKKEENKAKPEKSKRQRKSKKELNESSKKLSIPGLPDEVLEALNLTDCNKEEIIRECLSKLTPDHPLYSVFAKFGDEVSRTKNFITYNDLSLTGKSWNVLYMLENLLNKYKPLENENNSEIIATDENLENTLSTTVFDSAIGSTNEDSAANHILSNISTSTEVLTQQTSEEIDNESINNEPDVLSNPETHETIVTSNTETHETSVTSNTETNISNVENNSGTNETTVLSNPETNKSNLSNPETNKSNLSDPETNESNQVKDVRINLLRVPHEMLSKVDYLKLLSEYFESKKKERLTDAELQKVIAFKNKIDVREVKINLLRLPHHILHRIDYFRLTSDYFNEKRKNKAVEKVRRLTENPGILTRKREREMEKECIRLVKRLKSYDLDSFEKFCHSYNVNQGLCSPIPAKIHPDRKSVDNRSEVSYGYPVTPESGRFSITFHTDSECEQMDFDLDHESENRRTLSRADSGCCLLSPVHECQLDSGHEMHIDSGFESHVELGLESQHDSHSRQENHVDGLAFSSEPTPTEEEDPTLQKLKQMFPNSFADPQRAEILKNLIRPPEEQQITENYVEWKNFIDEKTARESEFNIHQYGTNILNSFPTQTKNEMIDFQSIVKGKSIGDISRYFVSTLQLANSYNVEICDERGGQMKPKGFKLKYLTSERPLEEFDEFILPSESQFMRNLPSTSFGHSTPYNKQPTPRTPLFRSQPVKRRRVEYAYE